jgi:hypothetical protein
VAPVSGSVAPGAYGSAAAGGGGGGSPQGVAKPGVASAPAAGPVAGSAACTKLQSSDQGITPSEVRIDVSDISLAGPIGNQTFNIRPDVHRIASAVADSINRAGGLDCRKLVITQYDVNPLDSNDEQSKCLQMVQDHPFAVLDYAGYVTPVSRACFVQAHLPLETATSLGDDESQSSYPYMFSAYASSERQVRDWILGANALGVFSRAQGFRKIGLFEDACDPKVNAEIDSDLANVGIHSGQVSKYTLDCTIAAPPNEVAQAVVQHKLDGVTNVFLATSVTSAQNYVQQADGQEFYPRYGASDYGSDLIGSGSSNWDAKGFNGAIGITSTWSAEQNSHLDNPQVDKCNEMMTSHGVAPFKSENSDGAVLAYCDLFNMFVAAVGRAGLNPVRTAIAAGLDQIGRFDSALFGDGLFNQPRKVSGGDFIRPIQWRATCSCFMVMTPAFKPGY